MTEPRVPGSEPRSSVALRSTPPEQNLALAALCHDLGVAARDAGLGRDLEAFQAAEEAQRAVADAEADLAARAQALDATRAAPAGEASSPVEPPASIEAARPRSSDAAAQAAEEVAGIRGELKALDTEIAACRAALFSADGAPAEAAAEARASLLTLEQSWQALTARLLAAERRLANATAEADARSAEPPGACQPHADPEPKAEHELALAQEAVANATQAADAAYAVLDQRLRALGRAILRAGISDPAIDPLIQRAQALQRRGRRPKPPPQPRRSPHAPALPPEAPPEPPPAILDIPSLEPGAIAPGGIQAAPRRRAKILAIAIASLILLAGVAATATIRYLRAHATGRQRAAEASPATAVPATATPTAATPAKAAPTTANHPPAVKFSTPVPPPTTSTAVRATPARIVPEPRPETRPEPRPVPPPEPRPEPRPVLPPEPRPEPRPVAPPEPHPEPPPKAQPEPLPQPPPNPEPEPPPKPEPRPAPRPEPPPPARRLLEIPYYSVGEAPYSWAAALLMVCQAVRRDASGDFGTPAIVGRVKVGEDALSTQEFARASKAGGFPWWPSALYPLVQQRAKCKVTTRAYDAASAKASLFDDIRSDIGCHGWPVLVWSSRKRHAWLVVGYDGAQAILHDPALSQPYVRCHNSWLRSGAQARPSLDEAPDPPAKAGAAQPGERDTSDACFAMTIQVAEYDSEMPRVTMSLPSHGLAAMFLAPKPARLPERRFSLHWSPDDPSGCVFQKFEDEKLVGTVTSLPGDVASMVPVVALTNLGHDTPIQVGVAWTVSSVNNPRSRKGGCFSVDLPARGGKTVVAGGDEIRIADFRDPANATAPCDYVFEAAAVYKGQTHDRVKLRFRIEPRTPAAR